MATYDTFVRMQVDDLKDARKYCRCLDEISARLDLIRALEKVGDDVLGQYCVEVILLQFRKIVELIAFSSLAANRKEYEKVNDKFHRSWKARILFNEIERINPEFFPAPVRYSSEESKFGRHVKHFETLKDGYSKKADLIYLWEKCHGGLHARNPFKGGENEVYLRDPVSEWVANIENLLSFHMVRLVGVKDVWMAILRDPRDGRAHVFPSKTKA